MPQTDHVTVTGLGVLTLVPRKSIFSEVVLGMPEIDLQVTVTGVGVQALVPRMSNSLMLYLASPRVCEV